MVVINGKAAPARATSKELEAETVEQARERLASERQQAEVFARR